VKVKKISDHYRERCGRNARLSLILFAFAVSTAIAGTCLVFGVAMDAMSRHHDYPSWTQWLAYGNLLCAVIASLLSAWLGMRSIMCHLVVLWWTLPFLWLWLVGLQSLAFYAMSAGVFSPGIASGWLADGLGGVVRYISTAECGLWLLWVIRARRRLSCVP
jgi:hypothetical protein